MTAETAGGAALQRPVWVLLLAASIFGAFVDDGVQWWAGMAVWTCGLLASSGTVLIHSGLLPRSSDRPAMTPAAAVS